MRGSLQAFKPDAIVGAERGGPFLADAATYGDAKLAGRVVRIPKGDQAAMMAQMNSTIEARIQAGERRFAFVESYFSGSAVRSEW